MIYTIGETVIDLIFRKMQPQAAKVGGSALNTSVSLGRLGNPVSFISEIGNDDFGDWCSSFLAENGVDASHLVRYGDKKTSLAVAHLNERNDARYTFYKEFTEPLRIDAVPFEANDILLFSSSFAINGRVRAAVVDLLQAAARQQALVYYDPNMRKRLSRDSQAFAFVEENLRYADVVHLSNEDAEAIFGTADCDEVYGLLQAYGVQALVFTQNSSDVRVRCGAFSRSYVVPPIVPVSTIGAGDTFNAGIIHSLAARQVTRGSLAGLDGTFWDDAVPFAISCSACVCQSIDNYIDHDFAAKHKR